MTMTWKRPSKILIATDLTPKSDLAAERAIELASYWGSRLFVVHVVDDNVLASAEEASDHVKAAEAEIGRWVRSNPNATDIEIETLVTLGNPAERILEKSGRLFVDLLIMGVGEAKSLAHQILGTTVDRVLRQSHKPVLCVRRRPAGPYSKLAIATDFSEPSCLALECARTLFAGVPATAVHAYDVVMRGLVPFDRITGPLAERHVREMTDFVRKMQTRFAAEKLPLTSGIGTPQTVLTEFVAKESPDLVVVGTHGRTGIRRAVLGSVAERLIGTLPCDVLAVPTPP